MTPAAAARKANVAKVGDREISIERTFDAPRDKVWRAMTDPKLVAQWWGRGNPLDVVTWDFKRGGHWRFVEHSDHGDHGFEGRFAEIDPPKKVQQTFEWDGLPGHACFETMTLEEIAGGKTQLRVHTIFFTKDERDGMMASGMETGMNQSYEALDRVLASL
ncbi:MAG TPA: SRPBCC family protein [Gemmatimonadaceae bacterium]|nr:SRPBCC family protein [Gemmatimonadaceae bacterium]